MSKRIKVGVLSENVNHGIVHQRIHLPFQEMDRDLFDFHFFDLGSLRHSDAFYMDVLVLAQPYHPSFGDFIKKARYYYPRLKLVVDIDDLVTNTMTDHPFYAQLRHNRLVECVQAAHACVFSTSYLASTFSHLNTNFRVIENTISKSLYEGYEPPIKPHKNCFIAGWTGGDAHKWEQFYTFTDGLKRFLRERHDAKAYFHNLCPEPLFSEFGHQVIYEPEVCDYLDYPGVAATYPFSVCMVGLLDHPFNNAKSDLKLLEMAPHGIPLIASPRQEFKRHWKREIMLYADTPDAWFAQLTYAYEHPEIMKEMAKRARDYVLAERTSDKAGAAWTKLLTEIA